MKSPLENVSQLQWKSEVSSKLLGARIKKIEYSNSGQIFIINFKFGELHFWNNRDELFIDTYLEIRIGPNIVTSNQRAKDRKLTELLISDMGVVLFLDGPNSPIIKVLLPEAMLLVVN